jgi:dihydropteroate synthase
VTILKHGHGVGFTARDLPNFHLLQRDDQFWLWLIGTAILVLWHGGCIRVTELPAAAATPRVEATLIGESDRVRITAGNLTDHDVL